MSRAQIIADALVREFRVRLDWFAQMHQADDESDMVPVPYHYGVDSSDLDVMALAEAVDAALLESDDVAAARRALADFEKNGGTTLEQLKRELKIEN